MEMTRTVDRVMLIVTLLSYLKISSDFYGPNGPPDGEDCLLERGHTAKMINLACRRLWFAVVIATKTTGNLVLSLLTTFNF